MRVALGSDHGGFELKQEIIKYLEEKFIFAEGTIEGAPNRTWPRIAVRPDKA